MPSGHGDWTVSSDCDGLIRMGVVAAATVALLMGVVAVLDQIMMWLLAATGLAIVASAGIGVLVYRRHGRVATGIHVRLQPSRADYLEAREQRAVEAAAQLAIEQAQVVPGVVLGSRLGDFAGAMAGVDEQLRADD